MSENIVHLKVANWIANGSVGASSKTMALWLGFGVKEKSPSYPLDPDDLDRCLRLLQAVPELRDSLPKMAELSETWALLAASWDEIETSHLNEVGLGWTKARSAPKTYALMKRVIGNSDRASIVIRFGHD